MHLNIGLGRDVGAREDRNGQAVAQLLGEFVEVEIAHLETEVAEAASRLQSTLDVARHAVRLLHTLEDVSLTGELRLHTLLFLLFVDRKCLAKIDLLKARLSVF